MDEVGLDGCGRRSWMVCGVVGQCIVLYCILCGVDLCGV